MMPPGWSSTQPGLHGRHFGTLKAISAWAAAHCADRTPVTLAHMAQTARGNTGRLSGPRSGSLDWEGLGPVVAVLVAVHVAALLFWIVSLIKSSLSGKPKKADLKQH